MGKRRGKLRALGMRRVPQKFYVNEGFGNGHYCYRTPVTLESGEVVRFCESKDGLELWNEPLKSPTLANMGLQRDKFGKITLTKKV
jgi:hypothetical protein